MLEQLPARVRAERAGGCGSSSCAACRSAAATTTSSSERGGLEVFPQLVAAEHDDEFDRGARVSSGVAELDALLGGGLTGHEHAAHRPGRAPASRRSPRSTRRPPRRAATSAAIFLFDESVAHLRRALRRRSACDLRPHVDGRAISVQQIDRPRCRPASSPIASAARVEDDGARVVVIDSLNGYLNAMPQARRRCVQHARAADVTSNERGVATHPGRRPARHRRLAMATPRRRQLPRRHRRPAPLLRGGGRRSARRSRWSRSAPGSTSPPSASCAIGPDSIRVGEPLTEFHGVLTGVPHYIGGHRRRSSR